MIWTFRAGACFMLTWTFFISSILGMAAEPPTGKEIAEVVIQGCQIHSKEQILSRMDTKPGKSYSETTVQEDVNRFLKEGWFAPNEVKVSIRNRADGKITVVLSVVELPSTIKNIIYRGADHLGKEEIERLTGLKRGQPMNPAINQAARNAIMRAYLEKGRYWTSVNLVSGNRKEDHDVFFDIAEGPTVKVGKVFFESFGNVSGDTTTARLRTQIQSAPALLGMIGGEFNSVQVDTDVAKLREYYHNIGYLDARVQRELIWSGDHRMVSVVFHVEEGNRYKVQKLLISGNRTQNNWTLMSYCDVQSGEYYDKITIQADLKRLKDYYGYRGRPVVIRESLHQAGNGLVNVHYQIEER